MLLPVMHGLRLEHTFSTKAIHTFKKEATKNYMDYKETKFLTWQWQWKKLHTYKHVK